MIAQEIQPKPEKTPFLRREAVKFVPVDEFVKLRFRQRKFFDVWEYEQLSDAIDAVQKVAGENGKTYELTQEMHTSPDPRVNIARKIVWKISLTEYLAVRHKVLNDVIYWTTRRRNEYELLGSREVEKENEKLQNQLNDLNLTNKVIAAAKINLSSVV